MNSECAECGAKLLPVVLPQYERRGPQTGLVIFQDVPAHECPNCGEQYFGRKASELMEEVLRGQVKPTGTTQIATFTLKGPVA